MNSCEHPKSEHTSQYTTYLDVGRIFMFIFLFLLLLFCYPTIQEPYSVSMELGGKFQGKKGQGEGQERQNNENPGGKIKEFDRKE